MFPMPRIDGPLITILLTACLNDPRLSEMWFPMEAQENLPALAVDFSNSLNMNDGCDGLNNCLGVQCSTPQFCFNMWRAYECRCVYGRPGRKEVTENVTLVIIVISDQLQV